MQDAYDSIEVGDYEGKWMFRKGLSRNIGVPPASIVALRQAVH